LIMIFVFIMGRRAVAPRVVRQPEDPASTGLVAGLT
jgi:hypothetical protein